MRICEGEYWIVSGHPNLLTQFLLCHAYEERKSIGEDVKGSCEVGDVKGGCVVGDVKEGNTTRDVEKDEGKIHTAKIIEVSRLAPLPPDRIPAKVVNEDIVDKNHPNLLFRFEGNMYSVYCGLLKTGRDLRKAIWRVVMAGRNDA